MARVSNSADRNNSLAINMLPELLGCSVFPQFAHESPKLHAPTFAVRG